MTSSAKKAKCPVTLVVSFCTAKKPVTFTIPATKESNEASFKLCIQVLDLPVCLNIKLFFQRQFLNGKPLYQYAKNYAGVGCYQQNIALLAIGERQY